ncbi:MAG: hypothetical protein J3Q66DRAFT_387970 [Benniella sp.]|nr:MAG: hypothetical protein J3Q66DRAFT_387970 [Benniella sp.]
MDNMFNTDSGLRPPSPLSFVPGQGLFGDAPGYEDFRFPGQDFLNMPASPGLSSAPLASAGTAGAGTGTGAPSMMMMANGPSMNLFNSMEQRYFSNFLDALVGDQDFSFDPSAIPNLPSMNLFSQDPAMSVGPMPMPMSLPMGVGFGGLEANPNMFPLPSVNPQQHEMDFDMAAASFGSQQQPNVTASAKRTKTNKATATDSPGRTGTPLPNPDAFNSKIVTPMLSKLSLENSNNQNQANQANGIASSKGKKNKREKEEEREEEEIKEELVSPGINGSSGKSNHRHRSSTSSTTSPRRQDSNSTHERNNSVSDDYASDSATNTTTTTATTTTNNANSSSGTNGSTTAKRKPYKELLTEEEKRANHIASEQKRRNTIRNGFKDMVEIIPDLRDVNSSKSTILFKAVDFIKQLERRNRLLQEKASQLEARLHLQRNGSAPTTFNALLTSSTLTPTEFTTFSNASPSSSLVVSWVWTG